MMSHYCFFSYEISPFTPGGVGTYISSVAVRLTELGHKVTLVLDIDKENFRRCVEGVRNQSINSARLEVLLLSDVVSADSYSRDQFPSDAHWKSFIFAKAAELIHAKNPIDILEFVDYCGPAYYALLRRAAEPKSLPRNIVVRMHNTIELIDKCAGSNFLQSRVFDYWLERTAIKLADRILSPGPRYWSDVAAKLYDVPVDRIIISPPCRQLLPRIADGKSGRNIIFVGRISTIKGMDLFLQAMASICADGSLSDKFDKICIIGPKELVATQDEERILSFKHGIPNDKLKFLGNLSESDLIYEFSRAMFAVFPNRCESFCYAVHEAHLVGVPLILSAIPAFLDHFVDRESALFFDGTLNDLILKIRELIIDSTLRARLSESVLHHRERYEKITYGEDLNDIHFPVQGAVSFGCQVPQLPAISCAQVRLTVIYFIRENNSVAANQYISHLKSIGYHIEPIFLVESTSQGAILAFGRRWDFLDASLRNPCLLLNPGYLLILSDDFTLFPSFIERGVRMLSMMPAVGALLPVDMQGRWGRGDFGAAADLFSSLRANQKLKGFPLLMRLSEAVHLQQLLRDRSPYTALSLLLDVRSAGFLIIDDIEPTLARNHETSLFALPTRADTAAFLKQNMSRFCDYELVTSLVDDMQAVPDKESQLDDGYTVTRNLLNDLYHGMQGSVYLHVIEGSLSIISLVSHATAEEYGWENINLSGQYRIIDAKDRPLGILEMSSGSSLRADDALNMIFNIGVGPSGGKVALVTDNRCILLSLRNDIFSNRYVIPREIIEFIDPPPFEVPSREFHLSAYYRGLPGKLLALDASPSCLNYLDGCLFFGSLEERLAAENIFKFYSAIQISAGNKDINVLVDEIFANTKLLGAREACFFGLPWLDIANKFLSDFQFSRVKFIIPPAAIWAPAVALPLLQLGALLDRFGDRIEVLYPSALDVYFSAFKSARVYTLSLPVFSGDIICEEVNPAVTVIIDRNSAGEFYMGHMAAVVKILHSSSVNLKEIVVPSEDPAQDRIFEFFGLSHLVRKYQNFDDAIPQGCGQVVYLNPFPFGENIGNVKRALRSGWHMVISPYESSLLGDIEIFRNKIVHYWEDVDVISRYIIKSLRGAA